MEDLLYLVHRIPYPPDKGDKIRSFAMLRFFTQHYKVSLGAFIDDPDDVQYIDRLQELCTETCFVERTGRFAKLRVVSELLTGGPLTLGFYRSAAFSRWVAEVIERRSISRVVVFSSAMARFIEGSRFSGLARIVDFVDVDSQKWRQYAEGKRWPASWVYRREAQCLARFEQRIGNQVDVSTFVSEPEARLFEQQAGEVKSMVATVSNGVDHAYFSPDGEYESPYAEGDRVFVFTGAMDYWANIDAVCWFAQNVLPKVRAADRRARFCIVGARPGAAVSKLAQVDGVTVVGRVPDVRPWLAHATAAVVPLRIARGIQNKVLEAMSMDRPVIATTAAIEGLTQCIADVARVADEAEVWIDHCLRLLRQSEATTGGRDCVLEHYDWPNCVQRMGDLIESVVDHAPGRQDTRQ